MHPRDKNPDGEFMSILLLEYGLVRPGFVASYSMSKLAVFNPLALQHRERFARPAKNSNTWYWVSWSGLGQSTSQETPTNRSAKPFFYIYIYR